MDLKPLESYLDIAAEMPDDQPPSPSYPDNPDETKPINPNPTVPGTDAPEVNTGSRMDDDIPAEDIDPEDVGYDDEGEVGEIESQNP